MKTPGIDDAKHIAALEAVRLAISLGLRQIDQQLAGDDTLATPRLGIFRGDNEGDEPPAV